MKTKSFKTAILAITFVVNNLCYGTVLADEDSKQSVKSKSTWVANFIYKTQLSRSYENEAVLRYFNESFSASYQKQQRVLIHFNPHTLFEHYSEPENRGDAILKNLNTARSAFNVLKENSQGNYSSVSKSKNEAINSMLDIIGSVSPVAGKSIALGAKSTYNLSVGLINSMLEDQKQVDAQNTIRNRYKNDPNELNDLASKAYDICMKDPEAKKVLDAYFGTDFLNAKVGDSYETILHNNPDFATAMSTNGIAQHLEDSVENVNQLELIFKVQMESLNEKLEDSKHTLEATDKKLKNMQARQVKEINKATAETLFNETIAASKAGVYIVSSLVGMKNQTAAKQISVIGNSTIQLVETMHQISSMGTATGSIVMGGNFLGAAFAIAGLFNNTQSTDQIILEQLEHISKQIENLSTQMHERFDRIEDTLAQIYFTVQEQFQRLNRNIDKIQYGVNNIQETLAHQSIILGNIQDSVPKTAAEIVDFSISSKVDYCLNYKNFIGLGALSSKEFVDCYFTLASAALRFPITNFATDIIAKDQGNFERFQTLDNMNFLYDESVKQGSRYRLNLDNLPNPITWAKFSEYYLNFVSANWSRYKRIFSTNINTEISPVDILLTRGESLKDFIGSLRANEFEVIKNTIASYKQALVHFFSLLDQARGEFEKDNLKNYPIWRKSVNEFKNTYDPIAKSMRTSLDRCPYITKGAVMHLNKSFRLPADYENMMTPLMRAADQVGAAELHFCISAVDWVNTKQEVIKSATDYPDAKVSDEAQESKTFKVKVKNSVYYTDTAKDERGLWFENYGQFQIKIDTYAIIQEVNPETKVKSERTITLETRTWGSDEVWMFGIGGINKDFWGIENYKGIPESMGDLSKYMKQNWDGEGKDLRSSFAHESKVTQVSANLELLKENFYQRLNDTGANFLKSLITMSKSGHLVVPMNEVEKYKQILKSYIEFALPETLVNDLELRALLYSRNGLAGAPSLRRQIEEATAQLISGAAMNLNSSDNTSRHREQEDILENTKKASLESIEKIEQAFERISQIKTKQEKTLFIDNIMVQLRALKSEQDKNRPKEPIDEVIREMTEKILNLRYSSDY